MSAEERTGLRPLHYSQWHREASLKRYLGPELARLCPMIDVDSDEYCWYCDEPLALVETTIYTGKEKATRAMRALARRANVPSYVLYYCLDDAERIEAFRIRYLTPVYRDVLVWTPQEWADEIWRLRERHAPHCRGRFGAAVREERQRRML